MLNKTFYGIILPQFLLFFLVFIMYNVFYHSYSNHLASQIWTFRKQKYRGCQLLQSTIHLSIIIFFFVFQHMCWSFAPFVTTNQPSMLKMIEFGVALRSLSVTCYFTMDTVAQGQITNLNVRFMTQHHFSNCHPVYWCCSLYTVHNVLSLLMFILYISLYQFISAQSPHSMKGLLIGLSYAVRGISELYAAILVGYSIRKKITVISKLWHGVLSCQSCLCGGCSYIICRCHQNVQAERKWWSLSCTAFTEEYYSKEPK